MKSVICIYWSDFGYNTQANLRPINIPVIAPIPAIINDKIVAPTIVIILPNGQAIIAPKTAPNIQPTNAPPIIPIILANNHTPQSIKGFVSGLDIFDSTSPPSHLTILIIPNTSTAPKPFAGVNKKQPVSAVSLKYAGNREEGGEPKPNHAL